MGWVGLETVRERMSTGWSVVAFLGVVILPTGLAAQAGPSTVNGGERRGPLLAPAVRVVSAPIIDGEIGQAEWASATPISGFLQRDPVDGAPASERTEVRIMYDEGHLYFALHLFDREPSLIRKSILHREGRIDQDDRIIIALDSYHDGRNAYIFELNPFGTQGDALITDESMTLSDWNWEGVYESEARITEDGWELEVAIPFTTIRFADVEKPTMGVAFYRSIRRKNEDVFWPHISQEYRAGISQVSQYATLTGLEDLRRGRYIELKPYGILGAQSIEGGDTDVLDAVGLDAKYSITPNLTLDMTLNPDFAQVEADNVQINLSRFNLFFPEKREFFLERAGLFQFGDSRETETFFSRRIGLTNEIVGGGRLTGQVGKLSIGALALYTEDAKVAAGAEEIPGAANMVLRVRGDVFPRSTIGAIFTGLEGDTHNRVAGADAQFRFWGSSRFDAWVAREWDSERDGQLAGSAKLELRNEVAQVQAGFQSVDSDFRPALGFVRRRDFRKYSANTAVFPRFESSDWARQLVASIGYDYFEGQDGVKQGTSLLSHNMLSFQTGDRLSLNIRRREEILATDASIQGRTLDPGEYAFTSADMRFSTNESRTFSGALNLSAGDFWSGTRTQYGGRLTWKTGPFLTLSGNVSRNDIDLPVDDGEFSTTLFGMDILAAVNRNLFANALIQYDDVSQVFRGNVRVDWIHSPGSDLFVVFDFGYFTDDLDPRLSPWESRTGVVKLTYLKAL